MTAPVEPTMNYGFRYLSVMQLNASNRPKAASATPYQGLQVFGSTTFDLTIPDARKIVGRGEDGVTATALLAPIEVSDAKINVNATDPDVIAVLGDLVKRTVGEAIFMGVATDRQGLEPQLALLMCQKAKGLDTGAVYWHSYLFPSAQVFRKNGSMNDNSANDTLSVAPAVVKQHLWGEDFTMLADGFLSAQALECWSNGMPRITSFKGDNTEDEFLFPTNEPCVSTAGVVVYVNGVKKTLTTDYTIATTKVNFVAAPALDADIQVWREI